METEVYRKYGDILDAERPQSVRHQPMSMEARAAQFAPFAALTGYDAVIRESGRLTDEDRVLDESEQEHMDRILRALEVSGEEAEFLCFCPDLRKSGGSWQSVAGRIDRVDPAEAAIHLKDGTVLPLACLRQIGQSSENWSFEP